jgi:uncharacterized membrane protein (UPF0127 family)
MLTTTHPRHADPLLAFLIGMTALLMACSSGSSNDDKLTSIEIVNSQRETVSLQVEIADTQDEREHGLSNRSSLPRDQGMLFVIEQRGVGFWMKETTIPLSVAFIGPCGEIVALADMQPLSLEIHDTERTYAYGLEVNQGWFASHGIEVGSMVKIPEAYHLPACG